MRTDVAISFLKALLPEGPWLLNAFHAGTNKPAFACFEPGDENAAKWIAERNKDQFNVYFSPAIPKRHEPAKLTKELVGSVGFLWADADPRAGEDIASERERLLGRAKEWSFDLPKPTFLIWTGNGFQALWRLDEAVGDHQAIEDRNKAIAGQLEGDNVSNVDRILRLLGS